MLQGRTKSLSSSKNITLILKKQLKSRGGMAKILEQLRVLFEERIKLKKRQLEISKLEKLYDQLGKLDDELENDPAKTQKKMNEIIT